MSRIRFIKDEGIGMIKTFASFCDMLLESRKPSYSLRAADREFVVGTYIAFGCSCSDVKLVCIASIPELSSFEMCYS